MLVEMFIEVGNGEGISKAESALREAGLSFVTCPTEFCSLEELERDSRQESECAMTPSTQARQLAEQWLTKYAEGTHFAGLWQFTLDDGELIDMLTAYATEVRKQALQQAVRVVSEHCHCEENGKNSCIFEALDRLRALAEGEPVEMSEK